MPPHQKDEEIFVTLSHRGETPRTPPTAKIVRGRRSALGSRHPPGLSSTTLFERALAEQVAILPGLPFYVGGGETTVRLNFSNADVGRNTEGMHRLARALDV